MTKSELVELMLSKQSNYPSSDIKEAINIVIDSMTQSLALGKRVEVRGFGSFSLRYRKGRIGRNPKTGEKVELDSKYVPHFKPGKALRARVDLTETEI